MIEKPDPFICAFNDKIDEALRDVFRESHPGHRRTETEIRAYFRSLLAAHKDFNFDIQIGEIEADGSAVLTFRLPIARAKGSMLTGKTQVETLSLNGWKVGDILEGTEYEGHRSSTDRIKITALGEENFFCRWLRKDKTWTEEIGDTMLEHRDWKLVDA